MYTNFYGIKEAWKIDEVRFEMRNRPDNIIVAIWIKGNQAHQRRAICRSPYVH